MEKHMITTSLKKIIAYNGIQLTEEFSKLINDIQFEYDSIKVSLDEPEIQKTFGIQYARYTHDIHNIVFNALNEQLSLNLFYEMFESGGGYDCIKAEYQIIYKLNLKLYVDSITNSQENV